MSSTAQTHTYLTRDFGRTKRLVAEAILSHPGTTLAELETLTGLASKSITGRVGDLKKQGCLTTVDDPAGERLYFDRDRSSWEPRAAALEKQRNLDEIERFARKWAGPLDATTTEGLRRLWVHEKNRKTAQP